MELDGVRADVDDREALRPEPDERLQPAWEAHVPARGQAELGHRRTDERGVLRFHGDRSPRALLGSYLGQLRQAAADRVVLAPLVHGDRKQIGVRLDELCEELGERVLGARERGRLGRERRHHLGDLRRGQRFGRLQDGLPLLEPVLVHGLQPLDVHEAFADLDGGVAPLESR